MPALRAALLAGACLLSVAPAWAKELPVKTLSIQKTTDKYEIDIEYPATGQPAIDREISAWAKEQADDWIKNADTGPPIQDNGSYSLDWSFEVVRNDEAIFGVVF